MNLPQAETRHRGETISEHRHPYGPTPTRGQARQEHVSTKSLGKETCYQAARTTTTTPPSPPHNAAHSRRRSENKPLHDYNAIPAENTPPSPTNSVIVWFIFMHFVLLSVSVMFHSVLSDSCFDSVCQAMRM